MTDIFHVTPITPNAALIDICFTKDRADFAGRNLMVSFYRPDQLDLALGCAAKLMFDNGRFSEWIAAMKAGLEWSEENLDNRPYYEWLERCIHRDNAVAIMPDIPGAPSQLNDAQLLDWPFEAKKGVPVYHMDGPIARLGRLLEKHPLVAVGWIGHPKREPVGCEAYWRRVDQIEAELGSDVWSNTHMLRGIAVSGELPFPERGCQQPWAERAPIQFPHGRSVGRPLARATGLRRQTGRTYQ